MQPDVSLFPLAGAGPFLGKNRLKIGLEISSLAFPLSGIQVYINGIVHALRSLDTTNHYILTTKAKQYLKLREYGASSFWLRSFDVYHGLDGFLPGAVRAALKSAIVHDVLFLKSGDYHTAEQRQRLLRKLYRLTRRADVLITPSLATKKDLSALFPAERIYVVPNGCSESFRPMSAATLADFRQGLGVDRYLLFVGVFQRRKNIERLLDAFKIIRGTIPGLKLIMVTSYFGYGSTEVMQKVSEMKGDIFLKRGVGQEELVSLYNGAEAFLFPSLAEGFGLPVLEAMACGTPVVTSRISSMPEIGGDAVVYCDPYDTTDIASVTLDVLGSEARKRELRQLGLSRAAGFTWTESARGVMSVWEKNLCP